MSSSNGDESTTAPSKDEVKREKSKRAEKERAIGHMNAILSALRQRPTLHKEDDFGELRDFVGYATNNPDLFPPGLPREHSLCSDDTRIVQTTDAHSRKPPALTKGFASALHHRLPLPTGHTLREKPLLHVVSASKRKQKEKHDKVLFQIHRWSLHAVDGDGAVICVVVNTGLNDKAALFSAGAVIRLLQCGPLHFEDGDNLGAAMPLSNFVPVTTMPIDSKYEEPPPPEAMVARSNNDEASTSISDASSATVDPASPGVNDKSCHGDLCSLYGIKRRTCVLETFPVDQIDLCSVADYCPAYNGPDFLVEMNNNDKRFLCHRWCVTEAHGVRGVGDRKDPPPCVKAAIRAAFPDRHGQHSGFQKKPSSKKQRKCQIVVVRNAKACHNLPA